MNNNSNNESKDIVACMITIDRSLFGKANYLAKTLVNLSRSEFFDATRLAGFNIFNSRSASDWISDPKNFCAFEFKGYQWPARDLLHLQTKELQANENAGYALETSGQLALDINAKWVLFLEDDLDFCADFLGSVGRYLDHCESIDHKNFPDQLSADLLSIESFKIIAFGCPYPQISIAYGRGAKCWLYPISSFYGSQCFAIRPHDAISLGRYLQQNPTQRNPNEYDLMIHEWMHVTYPEHRYFLASVPSFVEHIGRESICTDLKETHRNPSWPGREWSYK